MDYRAFFRDIAGLDDEHVIDELVKVSTLKHFSTGEYFLRVGDVKNQVYFIVKGVLRGVILNEEGLEKIDCIAYKPGDVGLSSFATLELGIPSPEDLIACTPLDLIILPMKDVLVLLNENLDFQKYAIGKLQKSLEEHWKLQIILKRSSAKEKYEWFLQNYPGLIYQVSNKYIANYLGMDPATLSKLKNHSDS